MGRHRLSQTAQKEILEIRAFIARDNPVRALSFIRELRAKIAKVADAPLIYRERPELMPGLRAARHGQYLIFFKVAGDIVEVLRIRHGATDFSEQFPE